MMRHLVAGFALLFAFIFVLNINWPILLLGALALFIGYYCGRIVIFDGRILSQLRDWVAAYNNHLLYENFAIDKTDGIADQSVAASVNQRSADKAKLTRVSSILLSTSVHSKVELVSIPEPIDDALQDVIETGLKVYIQNWYYELISDDRTFINEVKYHIRYAATKIVSLLSERGQLGRLIVQRAIPISISHADIYGKVRKLFPNEDKQLLEQRVLDFMKPNVLHRAMYSRDSELAYLRNLVDILIDRFVDKERASGLLSAVNFTRSQNVHQPSTNPTPFVSNENAVDWSGTSLLFLRELLVNAFLLPLMDLIADPEIINDLLILLFDPDPMTVYEYTSPTMVPLLRHFADIAPQDRPDSLLQMKLSAVIGNTTTLYLFMNYLQETSGPIHYLQFLLASNEFNNNLRRLSMDGTSVTIEHMHHLHWEAWEIFKNYFHAQSPDCISFPPDVVNEMKGAVEIKELIDSLPKIELALMKPYKIVYDWLQYGHLISFCQSELYYHYISGNRAKGIDWTIERKKRVRRRIINQNQDPGFTASKLKNRMFGMFTSTVEDGRFVPGHQRTGSNTSQSSVRGDESPTKVEWGQQSGDSLSTASGYSSLAGRQTSAVAVDANSKHMNQQRQQRPVSPQMAGGQLPLVRSLPVLMNPPREVSAVDDNPPPLMDDDYIDLSVAQFGPDGALIVSDGVGLDDELVNLDNGNYPLQFEGVRDINKWRIRIPRVEPRRDKSNGRTIYVFVLTIERLDVPFEYPRRQWQVDRRYNEFYILESKLIEFHSEDIVSAILPAKKTFANKGRAFVENLRPSFEAFIQRLGANVALKGSDLLCAFLSNQNEFTQSMLSELNPWRAMKRMPAKFSREKGRNLQRLLFSMLISCNEGTAMQPDVGSLLRANSSMTKSKSGDARSEGGSSGSSFSCLGDKSIVKEKIYGTVFRNNCGISTSDCDSTILSNCAIIDDQQQIPGYSLTSSEDNGADSSVAHHPTSPNYSSQLSSPQHHHRHPRYAYQPVANGLYDLLLFASWRIFEFGRWVLVPLVSLRTPLRNTVDTVVERLLDHILSNQFAFHNSNIVVLINLIKNKLFYEETSRSTEILRKQQHDEARRRTKRFIVDSIPKPLLAVLTERKLNDAVDLLHDGLQCPRLNKQLTYQMLDSLILELFPNLKTKLNNID